MKKSLFLLFLVYNSLFAVGTYDGVDFSDYEEQAGLYFCNYGDYTTFVGLGISTTDSAAIVNGRQTLYTSLSQVAALTGIVNTDMYRIRQHSHLVDWNIYTNDFGMTLHQTNFIYALTGVLVGFVFLAAFVFMIIS